MNECKIVQDLLPLYAEDLISEETAEFICDHCERCENCGKQMQRCMTYIPEPEENPKVYKKALRKNQFNMICKALLLFVVVVATMYVACTKFDAYMKWKTGKAPVEAVFEAPYGNGKVTLVDWDASGESFGSKNTEGTLIWKMQMDVRQDEHGTGFNISEGAYAKHWENVQVFWAPNGLNFLMTADLLEGGNGIFIESYEQYYDEEGRHYGSSELLPRGYANGFVDVLSNHCMENESFPTGWETIRFSFLEWKDDSETLVLVFETDNFYRGVIDYHFPSDTITAWDVGLKRAPAERLRTDSENK